MAARAAGSCTSGRGSSGVDYHYYYSTVQMDQSTVTPFPGVESHSTSSTLTRLSSLARPKSRHRRKLGMRRVGRHEILGRSGWP